jgi:hypothetical protein
VQVLRLDVGEQRLCRDARVVDQRVDAAELLHGLVHQRPALRLFGNIGQGHQGLGAQRPALRRYRVELFAVARRQHQAGISAVGCGQLASHFGANSVGGAGDDENLHS